VAGAAPRDPRDHQSEPQALSADLPAARARIPSVARRLSLLSLVVTVAALGGGSARGGGSPVALVTAETQNALLALSLPSGALVRRIPLPVDPENVVVDPARKAVVVSARGHAVTVVSARTLRVLKIIRAFVNPHLAALSPNGRWAFVTDDGSGRLASVALDSGIRIVTALYVGPEAHHLSVSPDGSRAWIALGERARTIVVVDVSKPAAPRIVARFDPGFAAHDLAFSPSGRRVWVTASNSRFVTIFDAASRRPVARVPGGAPPQHVAFGVRDAFVTSGYGSSLAIVDRTSGRVKKRVKTPYGSFNVAISGGLVVTSSLLNGTVTELDDRGRVLMVRRVAPATRSVAVTIR
jgi:DNA-binding beta-propeller fold protein YncE